MRSSTKFYFTKPSLFKRIKTMRWMMKSCGYDLATAWRRAGMVI